MISGCTFSARLSSRQGRRAQRVMEILDTAMKFTYLFQCSPQVYISSRRCVYRSVYETTTAGHNFLLVERSSLRSRSVLYVVYSVRAAVGAPPRVSPVPPKLMSCDSRWTCSCHDLSVQQTSIQCLVPSFVALAASLTNNQCKCQSSSIKIVPLEDMR